MRKCYINAPRRSIGLLVLLDLPDRARGALLRIRDVRDPKTGDPQSFPGLAQVTVHGTVEPEEHLQHAILREASEELAEMFRAAGKEQPTSSMFRCLLRYFPRRLHALTRRDTPQERVVTLGCCLEEDDVMEHLRPLLEADQMRIVREKDLPRIRIVDPLDAVRRATLIRTPQLAMFPDELEALKRAFRMPFFT